MTREYRRVLNKVKKATKTGVPFTERGSDDHVILCEMAARGEGVVLGSCHDGRFFWSLREDD